MDERIRLFKIIPLSFYFFIAFFIIHHLFFTVFIIIIHYLPHPLLKFLKCFPAALPNFGSLDGPKISNATINMIAISPKPRFIVSIPFIHIFFQPIVSSSVMNLHFNLLKVETHRKLFRPLIHSGLLFSLHVLP